MVPKPLGALTILLGTRMWLQTLQKLQPHILCLIESSSLQKQRFYLVRVHSTTHVTRSHFSVSAVTYSYIINTPRSDVWNIVVRLSPWTSRLSLLCQPPGKVGEASTISMKSRQKVSGHEVLVPLVMFPFRENSWGKSTQRNTPRMFSPLSLSRGAVVSLWRTSQMAPQTMKGKPAMRRSPRIVWWQAPVPTTSPPTPTRYHEVSSLSLCTEILTKYYPRCQKELIWVTI